MSFDLPRGVILPVDTIDVVLDPAQHPFEKGREAVIDENWRRETEKNPALFDGEVVLLSALSYDAGVLRGRCHPVRYRTFMHWRQNRAVAGAGHAFAHPVLVSREGALVAIRMAAHTVNAGRVYFAAGSFEPDDFPGGRVDADLNMSREVREETGLDLSQATPGKRYHVLATETGTVIFRRYRMDLPADEIAARISAFVATEEEPEIEGPVIIRSPDERPDGLMAHMIPLMEWHFADPG